MPRHRSIEIDFDVHKRIEADRSNFDETDNVILRRLLGLSSSEANEIQETVAWSDDGVELPHGTPLRMRHMRGKQIYNGVVRDGKLVFDGESFDTLSGAASALAVTSKGRKTNLNGWDKIEAKPLGQSEWKLLSTMRRVDFELPPLTLDDLNL